VIDFLLPEVFSLLHELNRHISHQNLRAELLKMIHASSKTRKANDIVFGHDTDNLRN